MRNVIPEISDSSRNFSEKGHECIAEGLTIKQLQACMPLYIYNTLEFNLAVSSPLNLMDAYNAKPKGEIVMLFRHIGNQF